MKNIHVFLFSSFLMLFISFNANAQTAFTVNEVRQFMSKGEQNGIEITLPNSDVDKVKDALKSYGKKVKGKMISSKKSSEVFIDNAQIDAVSNNTVDIYVIVVPFNKGSKVTFFTDLGGAFVSSYAYPNQHLAMEAQVRDFAQTVALSTVSDQLKAEEKALKSLEKSLKSLEKDKSKKLKTIEKYKKSIADTEQDIIKNDADQAAKQQQIILQKQIIETIKTKKATLNY